jgi:hypothetical protein
MPMEKLTYTRPPSEEFIEFWANKNGIELEQFKQNSVHLAEDYVLVSEPLPIICVADGVTLEIEAGVPYPEPSGAAAVAKIFSEAVIKNLEKRYGRLSEADLPDVFRSANESIRAYNEEQGRLPGQLNYLDFDLFATTGAFAAVKDEMVYWGSICDSFVMNINAHSQVTFLSPPCNARELVNLPDNYSALDPKERRIFTRRQMRNGLDDQGRLIGYGVATGEAAAERYFNYGSFPLAEGDMPVVLTDGFEDYMRWYSFRELLKTAGPDELTEYASSLITKDPNAYGRERTLAVLRESRRG